MTVSDPSTSTSAPPSPSAESPKPDAGAPPPPLPEGPEADEVRAIESLYEAGDFREVDRRARALAGKTKDDAVRGRANELLGRVQLDPFILWVWGATVLFIAGIVYVYVIR